MNPSEKLLYISALAANGELDSFLAERGVPEFEESSVPPQSRKFGARPTFDRGSFDYEAYLADIERHFKK